MIEELCAQSFAGWLQKWLNFSAAPTRAHRQEEIAFCNRYVRHTTSPNVSYNGNKTLPRDVTRSKTQSNAICNMQCIAMMQYISNDRSERLHQKPSLLKVTTCFGAKPTSELDLQRTRVKALRICEHFMHCCTRAFSLCLCVLYVFEHHFFEILIYFLLPASRFISVGIICGWFGCNKSLKLDY